MLEGIWNLVWQYSLSYTWANEITQSPLCGIVQTSQVDIVPEQMDVVTPPRPSLNLGEERGHSVSGRHPYPENNGTLGVQGTSTHREPTNRDGWFPGTQSQGSSLYHDTAYLGDPRPQTGEPGPDRTRHCSPELRYDSFHSNGPSNYTSDPGHNAEHTEHPAGMYSSSTASRLFHEGVPQYENTLGYYTPHPHNDNRYRTTGTRLAGQTSLEYPTSMSSNDHSCRTVDRQNLTQTTEDGTPMTPPMSNGGDVPGIWKLRHLASPRNHSMVNWSWKVPLRDHQGSKSS